MFNKEKFLNLHQLELNFDKTDFTSLFQEIKKGVSSSIANCTKSRYQIAAEISEIKGIEISKTMLDIYTSESKRSHKFPAFINYAFSISTGCFEKMAEKYL